MSAWREVHRSGDRIALARDGASLIIEAAHVGPCDPDLADVIARLAPHLAFADVSVRGAFVERVAESAGERIVIGRYTRGACSAAYLLAAPGVVDIDDVVARHLVDSSTPFDHLAE